MQGAQLPVETCLRTSPARQVPTDHQVHTLGGPWAECGYQSALYSEQAGEHLDPSDGGQRDVAQWLEQELIVHHTLEAPLSGGPDSASQEEPEKLRQDGRCPYPPTS